MVSFDRTILPGGEGIINLKVNVKGKSGSIEKSVRILSNDPRKGEEKLTFKAFIKEPILLSTKNTLKFDGKAGAVLIQSVDIIAREDKPLIIKPGVFSLQEKMTYRIEEVEKGRVFKIVFTNIPQPAGSFRGSLKLMTNYEEQPEIKISISGNFSKDAGSHEEVQ